VAGKSDDLLAEKYARAVAMRADGMSLSQIATALGYANKAGVKKLLDTKRFGVSSVSGQFVSASLGAGAKGSDAGFPAGIPSAEGTGIRYTDAPSNIDQPPAPSTATEMSQRGFAKLMGCSYTNIQEYVRTGKIAKGWNAETGKIRVAEATAEFRAFSVKNGGVLSVSLGASVGGFEKEQEQHKACIENEDAWNGIVIREDITFQEALRIETILKARQRQTDLAKATGVLVEKHVVNRQLAAAGIEIRKAFERLGLQAADEVRLAPDRNSAIAVLEDAVRAVLERMDEAIAGAIERMR
jgi:hypothetical protein